MCNYVAYPPFAVYWTEPSGGKRRWLSPFVYIVTGLRWLVQLKGVADMGLSVHENFIEAIVITAR